MVDRLVVTRLMQNPLGEPAAPGEPGDIVAVSDGASTVYLSPAEYEQATEGELLYLIAKSGTKSTDRPD